MAPPPGSRAVRPVLNPGDLLASRYRLVRPVDSAVPEQAGPAVLWLAHDEVLARPVAAKVLRAGGRRGAAAARPFLSAAAAAGALAHPALARVYDAAVEERPAERAGRPVGEIDVAYVISEWVEGRRLAEVLAEEGPYAPGEAVPLVSALAEALSVAHARGVVHGRVHPGNVLVTPTGALRLTDVAVSAALPDRAAPASRVDDPDGAAADVRDLAAVLYALLTARWPATATPQPSGGVPDAPTTRSAADKPGAHRAGATAPASDKRGRLSSPRQVRAGVPRALDGVVVRALDPGAARGGPPLTSAAAFLDALEGAVRADSPPRPAPAAPRPPRIPPRVRRVLPFAAVVLLLCGIGASAYAVGRSIGTVATPEEQAAALATPKPRTAGSDGVPVDPTTLSVRDFDPAGDGRERPGSVPNAHDDDLTTAWETERYDGPVFAGLKPGVGLLVDFGRPTPVRRLELAVTPGTTVELRGAPEQPGTGAPQDPAAYPVLTAGKADGDRLALTPPATTADRYYLVWITGLAPADGKFSSSVAELMFTRAGG